MDHYVDQILAYIDIVRLELVKVLTGDTDVWTVLMVAAPAIGLVGFFYMTFQFFKK